jgi:hypothetical protein
MLTDSTMKAEGYLIETMGGGRDLRFNAPLNDPTILAVTPLYKRVPRRGFSDARILEIAGAQAAPAPFQAYILRAMRNMMHELQRSETDERQYPPAVLPDLSPPSVPLSATQDATE